MSSLPDTDLSEIESISSTTTTEIEVKVEAKRLSKKCIVKSASAGKIDANASCKRAVETTCCAKKVKLRKVAPKRSSQKFVIIPASVEEIADRAFRRTNIKFVHFEEGSKLRKIGYDGFRYCFSLKSIIIPASVEKISGFAFSSSSIESIHFEEGTRLKKIGDEAFSQCSSLKSITIPASVEEIDVCAMSGSSIESIHFEKGS